MSTSSDSEKQTKHPFWITAIAAAIMIIGARLVRAYTPLGHDVFADGFVLWAFLVDIVIHIVIFIAALVPLHAAWQKWWR
jgi:hypothetical protein